ncbi:MAG: ATP-binding protein [Parachlamydia sp.]|nr:ATP-binding protein [Parachlamydia sp.]
MDPRFLPHNTHLKDPSKFWESDPQLSYLQSQSYIYYSPLLKEFPTDIPGIYTLGGGRQIGKSTLLKQWMAKLLVDGIDPHSIAFFSGELIEDYHTLLRFLQNQIEGKLGLNFIIIDEVTDITGWDKAIKFAADAGILRSTILLLTGSDLRFIQEARMRFPGRRGKASRVNFHLYPLSFKEWIELEQLVPSTMGVLDHPTPQVIEQLTQAFQRYLLHGGYLTAINDLAQEKRVLKSTLDTYADWIRGDMLKRGKQEHYLREILSGVMKHYNSQISWNNLSQSLSIDHPATVADYAALLEAMDALIILQALREDHLSAAPKKAKKLIFSDPFIYHSVQAWLKPCKDPFAEQMVPAIEDPIQSSKIVEACVASHFRRFYPTYYIKAEGEIDIAYIDKEKFWPVEVKWTNQVRPSDLKQLAKYPHAKLITKTSQPGWIDRLRTEPIVLALLRLEDDAIDGSHER